MSNLVLKVESFIEEHKLLSTGATVLLAVSGGLDSMVMTHIFKQLGYSFAIAHCNFNLRGEESEGDEHLVRDWANHNNIKFHSISFETTALAAEQKLSIQQMARKLRYDWLEQIRQQNQLDHIATAHHLNDALETFLYNFTKGTGIRGLQGIPIVNGYIIRPLLGVSRKELEEYQETYQIKYREDSSNAEDKYARNKIRHHIIPVLELLNPALPKTIAANLKRNRESMGLYSWAIARIAEEVVEKQHQYPLVLNFRLLEHYPSPETVLFELLRKFEFNADQVTQIWQQRHESIGAYFYSAKFQLLIDRVTFTITHRNKPTEANEIFWLTQGMVELAIGASKLTICGQFGFPDQFVQDTKIAYLNADKIIFPLKVRRWQAGDYFSPLGMHGKHKKLQDFFTDIKLTRLEKEAVWILENGNGEICWVIGYRIDDRYKLEKGATSYFLVKYHHEF